MQLYIHFNFGNAVFKVTSPGRRFQTLLQVLKKAVEERREITPVEISDFIDETDSFIKTFNGANLLSIQKKLIVTIDMSQACYDEISDIFYLRFIDDENLKTGVPYEVCKMYYE